MECALGEFDGRTFVDISLTTDGIPYCERSACTCSWFVALLCYAQYIFMTYGGGTSGGPRLSFTLACSGIQMQSLKKNRFHGVNRMLYGSGPCRETAELFCKRGARLVVVARPKKTLTSYPKSVKEGSGANGAF